MPQMDGLTTARELRKRYSAQDLPIILLTAEAQMESALWEDAGIDACLVKPVAPDLLQSLLARLVDASVERRRRSSLSPAPSLPTPGPLGAPPSS